MCPKNSKYQEFIEFHEEFIVYFLKSQRLVPIKAGADPGFGQGGAPASEAESCQHSEAESCERAKRAFCGQGPGPA